MKKMEFSAHHSDGKQTRIGKKVGKVVIIMQMLSVVFAVGICVTMFRSLATGMLEQAGVLLAQAEEVRGRLDGIYHAAMDQEAAGKIARQVAEEMERAAR